MADQPPQPNADEREGVTRRHLLVGALVVFLPILMLGIAGAVVGYMIPRMEIDRQDTTPPPAQTAAPAMPADQGSVDEAVDPADDEGEDDLDSPEDPTP